MSVTAIPTTVPAPVSRTPEANEGPGPDHDGNADNKNVSASAITPAAPRGLGAMVDSKA
jgi:hypothetical protein